MRSLDSNTIALIVWTIGAVYIVALVVGVWWALK